MSSSKQNSIVTDMSLAPERSFENRLGSSTYAGIEPYP